MALRLRNRLLGFGSSSIGSVEGRRARGIHADSVFVAIIHQEWIALSCCYISPLSCCPCLNPPPFYSLCLFSLSLKTAFNRWTRDWLRLDAVGPDNISSIFRSPNSYNILNFCWHWFPCSWQATQDSNALLCLSIALLSNYGQANVVAKVM